MSSLKEIEAIGYKLGLDYNILSIDEYLKYQNIEDKYKELYPWIESILVFVFPFSNKPIEKKRYLSARFSYGDDYHQVVSEKLEEIASKLGLVNYQVMSDVSFLDEKLLAYLGGLGAYGKNNLIITKNYGTNIAIGEIITDKVFDYNKSTIDSPCLDCTICLKACPTEAISTSGFNRTKCISYLTQYISDEFNLYDKVLSLAVGCDICQVVCPFNKDKDYTYDSRFNFNEKSIINLDILKNLNKETFKNYYSNKSFKWIGYLKMLRNILTLNTNNNNITIEELNYYQEKFKSVKWFNLHLEYLKGKINGIN